MVGAAGFEPTTCSTQNCRATRLRYTPISTSGLKPTSTGIADVDTCSTLKPQGDIDAPTRPNPAALSTDLSTGQFLVRVQRRRAGFRVYFRRHHAFGARPVPHQDILP